MALSKAKQQKIIKEFKEAKTENDAYWGSKHTFANARKKYVLKFKSMWSEDAKKRMGKDNPHLEVNRCLGYINQAANETLEQDIDAVVEPRSAGATERLALVRRAQIMALRDMSNAPSQEGYALREQLASGIGAFRLCVDYADARGADKTLKWEAIRDATAWTCNPEASGPGLCTKRNAIGKSVMTKSGFEAKYGQYQAVSGDASIWENGAKKNVYEWWVLRENKTKVFFKDDGKEIAEDDYDKLDEGERPPLKLGDDEEPISRENSEPVVEQYILGDDKVLIGPIVFPSTIIPILFVLGREVEIGGETEIQNLTCHAEDANTALNFVKSIQAMLWAKNPIPIAFVPIESMGPKGEQDIAQAATSGGGDSGVAVVRYKSVDAAGKQIPPPRLEQPVLSDPSLVNQERMLREDIEATIGMSNTPWMAPAKSASGIALETQLKTANTTSFDFTKKWLDAVEVGTIIAEQVISRMPISMQLKLGEAAGKEEVLWVNAQMAMPPGMKNETLDPNEEYSTTIKVGPNSKTLREQSRTEILDYLKIDASAAPLIGDLYVGTTSNQQAKEMQRRLQTRLPPEALPQSGDPHVAMMAQKLQQLQNENGALQAAAKEENGKLAAELQKVQAQLAAAKSDQTMAGRKAALEARAEQIKLAQADIKLQVEQYSAETARFEAETARMVAGLPPLPPPDPTPAPGTGLP